jgi:hypothetical protein
MERGVDRDGLDQNQCVWEQMEGAEGSVLQACVCERGRVEEEEEEEAEVEEERVG